MNLDITCLFDLILYVPPTIFQLYKDRSSLVEPVLSLDKCVLLKDHNAVTPVRLEPAAFRSRVKHSTTETLRSLDTTWLCCGFQMFLPWKFTFRNSRKMTILWSFSYNSFVKLSLYNTIHFRTWFIPMDPKVCPNIGL